MRRTIPQPVARPVVARFRLPDLVQNRGCLSSELAWDARRLIALTRVVLGESLSADARHPESVPGIASCAMMPIHPESNDKKPHFSYN
eukprot:1882142-Rhodomonas_salina.2